VVADSGFRILGTLASVRVRRQLYHGIRGNKLSGDTVRYTTAMRGTTYEVTGVDRSGRRFKIVTNNWMHANSINLWRGTVWQVNIRWLGQGPRRSIVKRVWN
jgi:hypothetical protein